MARTKKPDLTPTKDPSFADYRPINRQQAEFHASKARNKLLIGGYGGGKSYPADHEAIFHCLENPGHQFCVFRNTWQSVEENIMSDFIDILKPRGLIKKIVNNKDQKDIILINDCKIMFRPLSLKRESYKGYHMCGFLADDPDTGRYSDLLGFLFSRMRNPPGVKASRFMSIITANYEGFDWLQRTYMAGRPEGGDEDFAYWICPTTGNPTLHDKYIEDLAFAHTPEWMDRFVYCNFKGLSVGTIYHMFDRLKNHIDGSKYSNRRDLIHIMAVDNGYTTCVLHMATDRKNVYIYDEFYEKDCQMGKLGEYLARAQREKPYQRIVIDPASGRGAQASDNVSVRQLLLKQYHVNTIAANNAVVPGIRRTQDLMSPAMGEPRLFIDTVRCPNLTRELGTYRWKEPANKDKDLDHVAFSDEPVKWDDHAVDTMRYGVMFYDKMLDVTIDKPRDFFDNERMKLPYYKLNKQAAERMKEVNTLYKRGKVSLEEARRMASR